MSIPSEILLHCASRSHAVPSCGTIVKNCRPPTKYNRETKKKNKTKAANSMSHYSPRLVLGYFRRQKAVVRFLLVLVCLLLPPLPAPALPPLINAIIIHFSGRWTTFKEMKIKSTIVWLNFFSCCFCCCFCWLEKSRQKFMRCCQLNRAFDAVYDPVSLLLLLLM